MDVDAIRADIAALMASAGYSEWSYVPGSVAQFPAAVVGVPTDIDYATSLGLACLTIPVTVCFSAADDKDAQSRLNKADGTSDSTSVFVALNKRAGSNWRTIHVAKREQPRYFLDGSVEILAADFAVEVYAQK